MGTFFRTKTNENINIQSGTISIVGHERIKIGDNIYDVDFPVKIFVEGDVHGKVESMTGDITINGNCEDVKTMSGDVDVRGNVSGKISTMSGDVDVRNK